MIFPSYECYEKAAHLFFDGARSLSEPLSFFMICAVQESFVRGDPTLCVCKRLGACVCLVDEGREDPIPL